jgi:hypothetical protein
MVTLEAYANHSDNVLQVLLPKNERETALKDFYRSNVSREHLFPGIDGFAQSLLNSIQLNPLDV